MRWGFWGKVARVVKRTGFLPLLGRLLLYEFLLLSFDCLGLDRIRVLGRGLWRRKFLEPH